MPHLESVLARFADARMTVHRVLVLGDPLTMDEFLMVYRSSEDIPMLALEYVRVLKGAGAEHA